MRRLDLLAVPLAVLGLWQLAASILPRVALASVPETISYVADGFAQGWLTRGVVASLLAIGQAFLLATVIGLLIGFSVGLSKYWMDVLEPIFVWLTALPKITLFPIFLLLLGLGDASKVAYGVFVGVFPLIVAVLSGMKRIPTTYWKVARLYRLSFRMKITRIIVPSILPTVGVGLRFCLSFTYIAVIVSEMFSARSGAGRELVLAIVAVRPERVYATASVLVVVALVANAALALIQSRVMHHGAATLEEGVEVNL